MIMRSAVTYVGASVAIALVMSVGVSCMPMALENAHFMGKEAVPRIRRLVPESHATAQRQNVTKSCNKTGDNSTTCNTNIGLVDKVKNLFVSNTSVIYRALVVLGSISLIVLAYISFRYFR